MSDGLFDDRAVAGDYNYWASNAAWRPWPDYSEFLDFLELNNYPKPVGVDAEVPRPAIWAFDAAVSRIAERCQLPVRLVYPTVTWNAHHTQGSTTITADTGTTFDTLRIGATLYGAALADPTTLTAVASTTSATLSVVATYTGTFAISVYQQLASPTQRGLVPPEVAYAAMLQGARWLARRRAVEGVIGASELGGVIRYSSLDADIEHMIANYLVWGLA